MQDKLLSTFIWQNKRPGVRLQTLILGKDRGGLSVSNIKYYFWGSITNSCGSLDYQWHGFGMGKHREEFTARYTSISFSVFEQAVTEETGLQKCMDETHLESIVDSPKEHERDCCPFTGYADWWKSFKRWAGRELYELFFSYLQDNFSLYSLCISYFQIRQYIASHKDWNIIKNASTNTLLFY